MGGGIPEVGNTYDQLFAQAAKTGANKAGASGFTDLGGTMAGRAMGQELGIAAERAAGERAGLQLQAAGLGQQGRQAGINALTNIGSASAGAAGDVNALNLQSGLGYGGLNVDQRGQDYGYMGQGTNKLGDVASLVNAVSGANLGAGAQNLSAQQSNQGMDFSTGQANQAADLSAQQGNQAANLSAQQGNQNAGIAGYNAQAGMIGTQGNIYNTGQQTQVRAGEINANTGLAYTQLEADNQNKYNEQLLQQQNITGNQALQQQQNQIGGATDLANAAGGLGQTAQTGDVQREQNRIHLGNLANQILQGGADAEQAQNDLFTRVLQGDQDAMLVMQQNSFDRHFQAWLAKGQNKKPGLLSQYTDYVQGNAEALGAAIGGGG